MSQKVSEFFENDHRELDGLLAGVNFDAPWKSLKNFQEFDRRLERHIDWEENLLFPAVGRKAPTMENGPIRVMRLEHRQIRQYKAAAAAALAAGDGAAARRCVDAMLAVLGEHNTKEEQILYPACDGFLTPDEAAGIMNEIRAACRAAA